MTIWRRLIVDSYGASAAEFALVLVPALLLLFGVIDVGRYVWHLNQYEKAVQMGARYAVATAIVPSALNSADFEGQMCNGTALVPGDPICAGAMQTIVCTNVSCRCMAGGGLCFDSNYNATAFGNIVSRMRVASKRITPSQVEVIYSGSGLGYVGDPATTSSGAALADVAPIVTVKLTELQYRPITLSLFGAGVKYPDFSYSLTLEDGDGTVAS